MIEKVLTVLQNSQQAPNVNLKKQMYDEKVNNRSFVGLILYWASL